MRGIAATVDWGILWVLMGFTHVDHLVSAERSGPEDGCLIRYSEWPERWLRTHKKRRNMTGDCISLETCCHRGECDLL